MGSAAHRHPHPSGAEAKIQKAKSKASAGEGNSMRSITGFRDILGEALNKLTLIHLWFHRFQHLPYTSPNITHASPKCGEIMITMP